MTPHEFKSSDVREKQIADAISIDDGEVTSQPIGISGLWRIVSLGACRLRFGPSVTVQSAALGEPWPTGHVEIIFLHEDDHVACVANLT